MSLPANPPHPVYLTQGCSIATNDGLSHGVLQGGGTSVNPIGECEASKRLKSSEPSKLYKKHSSATVNSNVHYACIIFNFPF